MRRCIVENRKGIFHGWMPVSYTKNVPSPQGTKSQVVVLNDVVGLVEFEDGHVEKCKTNQIKFCSKSDWDETT